MLKNIIYKHGSLVILHRDFQVPVLLNKKLDRTPGQEQRQKWFIGTSKEEASQSQQAEAQWQKAIQSTGVYEVIHTAWALLYMLRWDTSTLEGSKPFWASLCCIFLSR